LNNVPNVASYDMVVHPRDLDLVIGTHGRSIWVMDVEPLHAVSKRINEGITAIQPEDIRFSSRWGTQSTPYREAFTPSSNFMYFVSNKNGDNIQITIKDTEGKLLHSTKVDSDYGFNVYDWDLITKKSKDGKNEFIQKGISFV
jgi:hypothetical protein